MYSPVSHIAVDGAIVDRLGQPRDDPEHAVDLGQLAVRQRHPAAESGRADPLALGDRVGDPGRVDAQPLARDLRHLVEQRALVPHRQVGADRVEIEKL